jgi:glycosyltransferase involved in cell wall biosynthesis
MKILYVVNGYPTDKRPDFCIFTKGQIDRVNETRLVKSELVFVNARENGLIQYLKIVPLLRSKINNSDLVHCFHGLTLILVFLIAPRHKIIVSFLNSIEYEYSGNNKLLIKPLIAITRLIIKKKSIYKIFKDKIPLEFEGDNRSIHLPNGVDLKHFYPLDRLECKNVLKLDSTKRYILFVSSRDINREQKRYDRFSEVITILINDYHFSNLEELVLCNVPRSKVLFYFNAAELHLLTSDYEGSPNSVKEAMACNLPVVATNVGNVFDMFDGLVKEHFVSNSFDAAELASLSAKILTGRVELPDFRSHLLHRRFDDISKTNELLGFYKKAFEC